MTANFVLHDRGVHKTTTRLFKGQVTMREKCEKASIVYKNTLFLSRLRLYRNCRRRTVRNGIGIYTFPNVCHLTHCLSLPPSRGEGRGGGAERLEVFIRNLPVYGVDLGVSAIVEVRPPKMLQASSRDTHPSHP